MEDLAKHKATDIHGLKLEFLSWVAHDLYEPIRKPLCLVVKEVFPGLWTINIIQMIFKSWDRCFPRNYMNNLGNNLETTLGKLYDLFLEGKN
jgi:hypothetical protein